ncbi:MAG: single-stranded DNA-binding protein [Cyanobacteria bacterium CRU_2_1]|nr:single-stranded DNA-binding protein [Cyanobacteria bacterium RU_5_0]NJR59239.1 single-stranded DNA-binding protein [Cyanobacteria bacterium CRU_2_1]
MNNCVLMAEIVQDPQLRYTPDSQLPIAEMMVEFPGLREGEPSSRLKVVGWGNLAQEIQEHYHQGDRVIIEGRLGMNRIDRPEGFKETRPELTAQKIHLLGTDATLTTNVALPNNTATTTPATPAMPPSQSAKSTAKSSMPPRTASESAKTPAYSAPSSEPGEYDEIPF